MVESSPVRVNGQWLRDGNTGCVFARIIAERALRTEMGGFPWKHHLIPNTVDEIIDGVGDVVDLTHQALATPETQLTSFVFPGVTTAPDLTRLVHHLGQTPPYHIDQLDEGKITVEDPNTYYGVHLRIAMPGGQEAWPMMLGNYPFFSPGRRAPVTELIFRNTPEKGNPTTLPEQVGVDDSILDLSPTTFAATMARTKERAVFQRAGFPQAMSRARIAVVVPKSIWDTLPRGGKT